MCHTSKQKYVSHISKLLISIHKNDMHGHINKQYVGIIKMLKVFNLKNNIKTLKWLHKNYLNVKVQLTNSNLNHDFSNRINNTCEKKLK
jgi:hypothetical protein